MTRRGKRRRSDRTHAASERKRSEAMWMTDYVRAIKRQLRDRYGFTPSGGTAEDPTFADVPDGEYPMEIDGRIDRVKVVDGRFRCCNFEDGEGSK